MNKKNLIDLKSFLESLSKEYVVVYTKNGEIIGDENKYSDVDIITDFNNDSRDAVSFLMNSFDKIIRYCAINKIDYVQLVIRPSFGFLISTEDYDEERSKIINEAGILEDTVVVDFYKMFYVNNGEKIELDSDKILGKDCDKHFLIPFSNFMMYLNDAGLDFDMFVDFYHLIFNSTSLDIVVDFDKRLKLVKK